MIRLGSAFDLEIAFLAVLCAIAVLLSFARAEPRIARWAHARRCWWCADPRHREIGSGSDERAHMVRDHGADPARFAGVDVRVSHLLTHRRGRPVYADVLATIRELHRIR